jgi:hypothetical protein
MANINTAKLLLGLSRIVTGIQMVREATKSIHILTISMGDMFGDNRPDDFHVTKEVLNLIPGHIRINPRDDYQYPYEAVKEFMGSEFKTLLQAAAVQATRTTRKAA